MTEQEKNERLQRLNERLLEAEAEYEHGMAKVVAFLDQFISTENALISSIIRGMGESGAKALEIAKQRISQLTAIASIKAEIAEVEDAETEDEETNEPQNDEV